MHDLEVFDLSPGQVTELTLSSNFDLEEARHLIEQSHQTN
jgi:hypothetical protein